MEIDYMKGYNHLKNNRHGCGLMDQQCEWELCSMDMQEYGPETCWYQFCNNNCDE